MLRKDTITIWFYANDIVGNFGFNEVVINKGVENGDLDSPSGGGIPFGKIYLLLTGISIALLIRYDERRLNCNK